jgi:hypothetical protein
MKYVCPKALAVTVGNKAKFPQKVPNIRQTHIKYIHSPALSVNVKVKKRKAISKH